MKNLSLKQSIKQIIILLILSSLLCLSAFLLNFSGKTAYAEATGLWTDEIDLSTYSLVGTGTEADPYKISTPNDLAYMSKQSEVNASVLCDKYYILTNNIDLSEHFFTPIGSADSISQIMNISFSGYNPQTNTYHLITGLKINNNTNNTGLFGYINYSNISSLSLSAEIVSGGNNTGAIAGFMNSCVLNDITVNGQLTGTNNGLGGLVGAVNGYDNLMQNCINNADIASQSGSNTGGIFAYALSGSLSLVNCTNNGNISGVTYVGGLGSGSSNTDMVFTLTNCINNGNILSLSPNQNYFSGLISNIGSSPENRLDFCKNTGSIQAPNSAYVSGLVAFGNSEITNSINTGSITGDTLVGGIAAAGVFNISGSHNSGNIEARSLGSSNTAGGIAGKLSDYALIKTSYNTGNITLAGAGSGGGILGSFEANEPKAGTVVISDCYNLGDSASAFIGSSNQSIVIKNGYSLADSTVANSSNITHSNILTSGTMSEIYESLTSVNPDVWGLWDDYNNNYPYLRSGLVSEVIIDLNGGTADGTYQSFYVTDLSNTVALNFENFQKTGYTFEGFSPVQNDISAEDFISKDAATLETSQPLHILYVQYSLFSYNVSTDIESQSADEHGLFEADGETPANTLTLFDNKLLVATQVGVNEFAYWAIRVGTELYQISDDAICQLENIFDEPFLLNYPYNGTSYVFVAVFEQSWTVEIEIVSGNPSWGSLSIVMGDQITPFNFNSTSFHIKQSEEPAEMEFILSANSYYKISQFSMTAESNETTFESFNFNDNIINRGVNLKSNLKISLSFTKQIYYMDFSSVYEDFSPTETSMILSGGNIGFYIDQTIGSNLIAETQSLNNCRFAGIKLQKADGSGYSNFLDLQAAGQASGFSANKNWLIEYLNGDGRVLAVAIYNREFQLNIIENSGNGAYGSLTVFINDEEETDYNNKFYDLNTNIRVEFSAADSCYLSGVVLNGLAHQGSIDLILTETVNILVTFEKTRYYIDIYTIDFVNQRMTDLPFENLVALDAKIDSTGTYVSFDDELYIINNRELENRANMKFISWYFVKNGSELIPIEPDINDNLQIIVDKAKLSDLAFEKDGKNYISIAAKIINIYVLDINLSDEQKQRGNFIIEEFNGTEFEERDNLQTEFNIGSILKITAMPYKYFAFAGFENANGDTIAPDIDGGRTITLVLERSRTISLYFDTVVFEIETLSNLNSANGVLSISTNIADPEGLKVGDNLLISFSPSSNLQVRHFDVNNKTLAQLQTDFGGQILGDSVVINVSTAFLDWLSETGGQIDISVSTSITTQFLIILLGALVVIIFLIVFLAAKLVGNSRKKKLLLAENIRKAKTRHGLEFKGKLQSLLDETHGTKGEPDEPQDIKKD